MADCITCYIEVLTYFTSLVACSCYSSIKAIKDGFCKNEYNEDEDVLMSDYIIYYRNCQKKTYDGNYIWVNETNVS